MYDVIDNKININETIIGLDFLRDTNPTVVMSNIRNEPKPIYEIATSAIKEAIDKDNLEKQLTFFIDIKHDGNKSNITLVKEKQLTDEPSLSF